MRILICDDKGRVIDRTTVKDFIARNPGDTRLHSKLRRLKLNLANFVEVDGLLIQREFPRYTIGDTAARRYERAQYE